LPQGGSVGPDGEEAVGSRGIERLIFDLKTAWLEGSDADLSNLIDEGLREPKPFAWALVRRAADERVVLLLSAQRALVGAVTASLYGVCAALRNATIVLTFYVASEATEDELEDLRAVGAEVLADFTGNFQIEETFNRVAQSDQPLATIGHWVYLKRGFKTIEH
jgi:hypothetical protein